MYEIYENIINAEEPTLTQLNAAFETHFAPTSNPTHECYLFRQLIHSFPMHPFSTS